MKTSVDKLSDTRVKLNVSVPFDELGKEIDQAYKAIAQQVNIPGFRRGKAPRQLIDARFGRGPILEQVVNDMLPTRYEQALAENEINPLGQPEIEVTKIEDNDVVEFTAEVDVRPEIEVPDFSKISVKVPELKLDDDFVQMASEFDTVEELRNSTREQVEENAKAKQAADIRDEVLKAALAESTFALPESVVDEQVHNQLHQLLGQMAHDENAFAQLLEAQGTTREEFDKQSREQAEESVRTQLFLDAVAEQEQPEVSQQELTDHILFTAQSYGMDPNQFVAQLQQSGQIANLFSDVRRGKALAIAISRTQVADEAGNTVDPNEYFGEVEENAADTEAAETTEATEAGEK